MEWWIGVDSWVLQDGNYTDIVAGERRQFALELGYDRQQRLAVATGPAASSCRHVAGTRYSVTGELLRAAASPSGDAFVLDVGPLAAYTSWLVLDDLAPPAAGTWLSGEVGLHIDPFFYMDELARLPGMPPLIHTWSIQEVQLETTPLVVVEHGDPRYPGPDEGPTRVRDRRRESWRTVERTRMWDDVGGYRLRCLLEDVPPVSSMALSGASSPYGPLPRRA